MQTDSDRAFLETCRDAAGALRFAAAAIMIPLGTVAVALAAGLSTASLWLLVLVLALLITSRVVWPFQRTASPSAASKPCKDANGQGDGLAVTERGGSPQSSAVVGVIRFANHDAMAAFDAAAAEHISESFAARLHAATGPQASVARVAPDCHAIWFAGEDGAETATKQLAAIARVMAQEIVHRDLTVLPDIHVGAAQRNTPEEVDTALLARARAAALALNRFSTIELSKQPAPTALADRFAMEQALRQAVRNGELHLHYQPFVDTRTGQVVGAETLLRWRHPKMGDVSTASFVPLLEETGLIHEIGLWTLNSACRQLNVWRRNGRADLRLAVNLSAVQLQNPALKPLILRTVASHGLSPGALEIELTETAAMKDPARTRELFQQLRDAGFGIAIDDFGNGYSNLNYLKDLPFTKLKIDREFVSHADTLPGSRAICKALVELGAGLGISVLAEGTERAEEVRTLEQLGCTHFQGFYFSRGLSAAELTAKLDDPAWLAGLKSPASLPEPQADGRTNA